MQHKFDWWAIRTSREIVNRELGKVHVEHGYGERICVVCEDLMTKRRGAKTCSPTCRKRLSDAHRMCRLAPGLIEDERNELRRRKAQLTELLDWLSLV